MASLVIWLLILPPIGIFVRQFAQVRRGARRRAKGTWLFFSYSVVPVLVYVSAFAALVGTEEVIDSPLVSEGLARTFLLVVGVALAEVLLLTACFALAVCGVRKADTAERHGATADASRRN
jgi:hypothetical protein